MSSAKPALRISGPGDLLAAVPRLLGFHPEESLVIIGLADGQLIATARMDLTDCSKHVEQTVGAMVRGGATELVGAVFTATRAGLDAPLPHTDIVDRLDAAAKDADVQVRDCLLVSNGRRWSYTCTSAGCCPPEGTILPSGPGVFEADATVLGMTVAPNRAALRERFTKLPDTITPLLSPELEAPLGFTVGELLGAAAKAERPGKATFPSDEDAARFAVALTRYPVRDALWLAIDEEAIKGGELWLDLARRLPSPYDAPALFLYAWGTWRQGDGTVAGMAAQLAVESDPKYSAADLLLVALAQGVDPRRMPKLHLPRSVTEEANHE